MAINVIKSPGGTEKVQFIKDGAYYRLQSTSYLSASGGYAYITLTISGSPSTNETMLIEYVKDENISLPFVFKNAPDESGLQLKTKGTETEDEYSALIAAQLQYNYSIARDFNVSSDTGGKVYIIAKEKALMSPVLTFSVVTHVSAVVNNAGSDVVQYDNYRILSYVTQGSTRFPDDKIPVITNGIGELDVADYCLTLLDPMYTQDFAGAKIVKLTGFLLEFAVQFAEYFGDPATCQAILEANLYKFKALRGGVGKLRLATMQPSSDVIYNLLKASKQALTWQPTTRTTDRLMQSSLFYLHFDTATSIRVKCKLYFSGGSTDTYTIETKTGCAQYDVYEFVTNIDNLFTGISVSTHANQYVVKYDVWLEDIYTNALLQTYTFNLDYTPYQFLRYFVCMNSLSGFDWLRTTGVYEKNKNYEFTPIAKILTPTFVQTDFENTNIDTKKVEIFKAATGWFNKESDFYRQAAEMFEELFLSEKPFELTNEGPVPIQIIKADHVTNKDDETLIAIQFEYRKTYTDKVATNVVDSGTALGNGGYFGEGFGGGFLTEESEVLTEFFGI